VVIYGASNVTAPIHTLLPQCCFIYNKLNQGWANGGPRATSGRSTVFIRPSANH